MGVHVKPELEPGLVALGLSQQDLLRLGADNDFEKAKAEIAELRERARKGYKRAAFELHPDRTGNDQAKTDLLIMAKRVLDALMTLEVVPVRPRPQPVPVVRVWVTQSGATGTGTVTANYTTYVRTG